MRSFRYFVVTIVLHGSDEGDFTVRRKNTNGQAVWQRLKRENTNDRLEQVGNSRRRFRCGHVLTRDLCKDRIVLNPRSMSSASASPYKPPATNSPWFIYSLRGSSDYVTNGRRTDGLENSPMKPTINLPPPRRLSLIRLSNLLNFQQKQLHSLNSAIFQSQNC